MRGDGDRPHLRTPTLDDVFLELTGNRIEPATTPQEDADDRRHRPHRTALTPSGPGRAGFVADLVSVAGRALRSIPREPESGHPGAHHPALLLRGERRRPAGLQRGAASPGFDYKAFQLPVAIIFAVTGISRASSLVTDIQDGYFDRLLLTPMRRVALLLGLMVADFALVVRAVHPGARSSGFVLGVRFETGLARHARVHPASPGFWGLVFTGFPYAIALKTGNPAAVASSFILFFPFAFLTTAFLPKEALTGWLAAIATFNPVTYLLAALRSLIIEGWDWTAIGQSVSPSR